MLKSLFSRLIVDPTQYLQQGQPRESFCVPACVTLTMSFKLDQLGKRRTIAQTMSDLNLLPFESLLDPTQSKGLTLSQISDLEKLLSPIPTQIIRRFPQLQFFEGIAISAFSMQRRDSDFRLFPTSLSHHSRNSNFFQIDVLIDNNHIRPVGTVDPEKHQQGGPRVLHTLVIKNLGRLLNKFKSPHNIGRDHIYPCRTCLGTFSTNLTLQKHYQTCGEHRRGVSGRRRSNNILVHKPFKYNKFSGKMERSGLYFRRRDCGKMLRPLLMTSGDYEQVRDSLTHSQITRSHSRSSFHSRFFLMYYSIRGKWIPTD